MLSDIPAVKPLLAGKTSLLHKVRTQEIARKLPDYIFESLASIGCAESEIAILTRCTKEELTTRAESLATGRARLKHALRRAQIKAALKGNSSMLIWLGKTYLNQRENPDPAISQTTQIVVDAKLLSALQSSYQDTLHDIRKAKAFDNPVNRSLPDNPVKQPDNLEDEPLSSARGTLGSLVIPVVPDGQYPNPNPTYLPDTQCTSYGTEPITSHNTGHVYLSSNSVSESELSVNDDTHPPGAGPTPQTHTPSPQMPTSLVSGNLGNFGMSGKYLGTPRRRGKERTGGVLKSARTSE